MIEEHHLEILKFFEKERDINQNRMRFCFTIKVVS